MVLVFWGREKMKKYVRNTLIVVSMLSVAMTFQNCSPMGTASKDSSSSGENAAAAAGGGATVPGVGSSSVPTGDALISRVNNALQGNVSPLTGNFAKALVALKPGLPQVTDPTKASGFDQAQLLVYAACSDLVSGGTNSKMTTVYGVTSTGTIAANQTKLIAAGVKMLDQYVAGLASQGPTSAQVTTSFTSLLTDISSASGNTSTIAFMSVCIAANTAGSTLMGF
jgi:hypothetical protein